jgi:hypothetical protein
LLATSTAVGVTFFTSSPSGEARKLHPTSFLPEEDHDDEDDEGMVIR